MDLPGLGRFLIAAGILLTGAGLLLVLAGRLPFFGRLPGDLYLRKGPFTFYFPVVTCLILSIVISLLLRLFGRK